jgi:nucleotide-binding universal stress UspA family protein
MAEIMVPVDGSEYSTKALRVAIDLARAFGTELVILHVVDLERAAILSGGQAQVIPQALEEVQAEGRQIVDDALRLVPPGIRASTRIVDGIPVDQIERIAGETQPSFVVMGTHGRTGLSRAFNGSVAEGVARRSPVPVVMVPPERRPTEETS